MFSILNGKIFGESGRIFLISENGKEGSKKNASAYLPSGAYTVLTCMFINFAKLMNLGFLSFMTRY